MLKLYELCKSKLSLNLKVTFLNLLIKPFITFFMIFLYKLLFLYINIKMSKSLSAKYYQKNNKKLQKVPHKR